MTKRLTNSRASSNTSSRKKPTKSTNKKPTNKKTANTKANSKKKQTETREVGLPKVFQEFLEDPDALQNLRRYLPGWIDEVLAVVLIAIGGVAFASLLGDGAEGQLSGQLANLLRTGFGDGAYIVALAIMALGILILLPKIGVAVKFTWGRLLALELTFVCFQGLLHALQFTPETRALAREGRGGGFLGWAVNDLMLNLVGEPLNIVILVAGLLLGVHWLLRIRRHHYRNLFAWLSNQLRSTAARLSPDAAEETYIEEDYAEEGYAEEGYPVEDEPMVAAPPVVAPASQRRPSIVPRQAEVAEESAPPVEPAPPKPAPKRQPKPEPPVQRPVPVATAARPAPATTTVEPEAPPPALEDRPALVVNGKVVDATPLAKERPSIVPRHDEGHPLPAVIEPHSRKRKHKSGRDDDPTKRYFQVDDFNERKKIGKRNEMLPPLELLSPYSMSKPSADEINRNASIIENTLYEFDIDADVIDVKIGPVVTQYAVSPIKEVVDSASGQIVIKRHRVDKIVNLQGDLSMALSAKTLRIEAPVPGHSYVGIEVPNSKPSVVGLRAVLETEAFFKGHKNPLCLPLGRDVSGEAMVMDLASMPHILIAGTTGSGKSVCLTSLVSSIVMNNTPEQVRLIMLDPKRVELTRFNGLPHLMGPVEIEPDRIIGVLRWTTREMDRRYKLLELENARNIEAYNNALGRRRKDEHLPYIVLLFDEIGDLMMSHPDETESTITRLAQKARAAGIHLVIATQRPSTDVLTGLIKANFPGRISFAVASGTDSRVILDHTGAETLLGRGDMLFLAPDAAGPQRVQGCFVSDEELEEVVMYWKGWHEEQIADGEMELERVAPWERGITRLEALTEEDPMLEDAIKLVCETREASTSMIQRRLGIGYPRAARLMDLLQELGVIGPPKQGGRTREVLIKDYKTALNHLKRKR